MTNKMTNRKALAIAIGVLTDMATKAIEDGEDIALKVDGQAYPIEEIIDKLKAMVSTLDNKTASTKRKPTKTQVENEALRTSIMDFLRSEPTLLVTCTDLSKKVPALDGMNNQKISALMKKLVESGEVTKYVEKGKSLFQLTPPDEGEGE